MFRVIVLGGVALAAESGCGGESGDATDAIVATDARTDAIVDTYDPLCVTKCRCPDGHFACEYACLHACGTDSGWLDVRPIDDSSDVDVLDSGPACFAADADADASAGSDAAPPSCLDADASDGDASDAAGDDVDG